MHIVVLAQGLAARGAVDTSEIDRLRDQGRRVGEALGAAEVVHHDFPDNQMDTVPFLSVVKTVEAEIARIAPRVVFTHHSSDLNVDHRIVNLAVLTASRPMSSTSVEELYAWETPSATEWSFGQTGRPFEPNVFVDVTDYLDAKVRAMALYTDEMRPFPHPCSPEALRAMAADRGRAVGVNAAEAFELLRSVRKDSVL